MSSGHRRVVQNTRERSISPDFNRAQAFAAKRLAEVLKSIALVPNSLSLEYGLGVTLISETSITTPGSAVVLDGCMVYVPIAGTELGVTKGAILFQDPDGLTGSTVPDKANPDDSSAKLVIDEDGVLPGSGTLVLSANAGAGVRVDIIECQRNPDVVTESDNRDAFNQTTGLFTPSLYTKVLTDKVLYRIRLGAPGAGLPATVQGWVPLAVACVPVGAADWDACTFYDVRPLLRDRDPPLNVAAALYPTRRASYMTNLNAAERRLSGLVERNRAGYRAGGIFTSEVGGAAVNYLDYADPNWLEPGLAYVANQLNYLWALFPGSLPRWVRYSKAAFSLVGGRVPQGMRGIPVVSQKGPLDHGGLFPSAPVSLPVNSGFDTGSTNSAVLLLAMLVNSAASSNAPVIEDDKFMRFGSGAAISVTLMQLLTALQDANNDYYDLVPGTHFPLGARSLLIETEAQLTAAPATEFSFEERVDLLDSGGTTEIYARGAEAQRLAAMFGGGTMQPRFSCEVPLPQNTPLTVASTARLRVAWTPTGAAKTAGATSMLRVRGWKL